ncbi:MAG: hypothetical protein JSR47_16055 [Proteobacteria bacterium]|nr:hypothetical protein [Pseudomonadota bacterium]
MQHHSIEQKNRLHRTFVGALDLLDTLGREPDRWEEECLSYALGAMACDLYSVAEVELDAFARPIAQRPPLEMLMLNERPQRFTKQMLRHGLDYVLNKASQPNADLAVPAAVAAAQGDFSLGSSSNIRSAT